MHQNSERESQFFFLMHQNEFSLKDLPKNGRSRYYYQNYEGPVRPSSGTRTGFNFPMPPVKERRPQAEAIYSSQPKTRCDNSDVFQQLRARAKLRPELVQKSLIVASLYECQKACLQETQFRCLTFNFMPNFVASLPANCELSNVNYRNIDLNVLENSEEFDFYGRDTSKSFDNCIDGNSFINTRGLKINHTDLNILVTQECTPDEMIFTLRTPEGFTGRIYTYKHFDRAPCYARGNGGQVHRLRIPRAESYPNCGTEGYGGNTQTNIVVVQHSELVQTSRDMIYNLTCTLQAPGESVVSSGYIGAG